jgi:hypothetical protein
MCTEWHVDKYKIKFKLVINSREPLAARYNWCQGPVPGRGPKVEKHWSRGVLSRVVCLSVIVKAVPLQAWGGPEGSRKLSFQDFVTTVQDGGKVVSLKHRSLLPPINTPGTHLCWRLSRPEGHSAIGRNLRQWKIHWNLLGSNQQTPDL